MELPVSLPGCSPMATLASPGHHPADPDTSLALPMFVLSHQTVSSGGTSV